MIKMVVEVWRRPDLTREAFDHRWLVEHGALVKKHAKAMGFVRYIQSHKKESAAMDAFTKLRGWKPPPDGITEVWWESLALMEAALNSPEGQAASKELQADEAQFCDVDRLSAFLSEEDVIFDYTKQSRS